MVTPAAPVFRGIPPEETIGMSRSAHHRLVCNPSGLGGQKKINQARSSKPISLAGGVAELVQ